MNTPVRFGPEAALEAEEAARWYEHCRAGLGLTFLAAIDDAVASIRRWPGAGAPIDGLEVLGIRRVPVSKFPYHVAYLIREEEELVYVLAVAHDRRRPMYWRERAAR